MDVVTLGAALSIMKKMPDTAASSAAAAEDAADRAEEAAKTLTIDDTLTEPGQPADAKATGDRLAEKLDVVDLPDTVDNANQLLSEKYVVDTEPYQLRPSGGNGADREFDTIVGGSVVWNQLAIIFPDKSTHGITMTNNNDGSYSLDGTADANINTFETKASWVSGHVYYLAGFPETVELYIQLLNGTTWVKNLDQRNLPLIRKFTDSAAADTVVVSLYISAGTSFSNARFFPQIFDLTQMFGSEIADYIYSLEQATAGAGVAWFRKYFPNDYYDYNAGVLMHVTDLQSHDTVGFNLFDVSQYLNLATNYDYVTNNYKTKKIRLLPNTTYYIRSNSGEAVTSPTMLIHVKPAVNSPGFLDLRKASDTKLFTTGDDGLLYIGTYDGTNSTVNDRLLESNICINLSWSGTRNGEYEPYVKHSYPLDPSLTLRGVPKLTDGHLSFDGDIYKPDGTVERRYGIVDLGTLNEWSGNGENNVYTTSLKDRLSGSQKVICPGFKQVPSNIPASNMNDHELKAYDSTKAIAFCLTGINTNNAKTMLSGVYLVYELAAPTTEQAEPYTSLQIVDDWGTEEYVTTSLVPVGHETKYPENLRAKIEGLPWNFANLIAPVETEFKATQNYTSGSLFIVNNVLYKATANIANGGNITPNTNCTATTLAEVIAAL